MSLSEKKAIIFDLDDTLYPMIQFAAGGYWAAGKYVEKKLGIPVKYFQRRCLQLFVQQGSTGRIFDTVLSEQGVAPHQQEIIIKDLVNIYRKHPPSINFYPDALKFLGNIDDNMSVGVITDGNAAVQRSKARALGLESLVREIIYTWDYGKRFEKPNPKSYLMMADRLKVEPSKMVYVGDNPHKDFIGAKRAGLFTVRVRRGGLRNLTLDSNHEAHWETTRFENISHQLKNIWGES